MKTSLYHRLRDSAGCKTKTVYYDVSGSVLDDLAETVLDNVTAQLAGEHHDLLHLVNVEVTINCSAFIELDPARHYAIAESSDDEGGDG